MSKHSSVKNIFFDIDNTLTFSKLGYGDVGYFEYAMAGMLCRLRNMSFSKSLEEVLEAEKKYPFMDPFHAVAELKISLADFRRELEELQSKFLHVFEDAIALIKALKNKGYGLYVSSNNSLSRAYAALHRTGLSDWDKSECFGGVFCPENIGFNKSNSQFYTKLIETGGFNPNEMLVIGDSMRDDGESPLEAGVKHAIIIDRKNKLENKNIPIVNDLRDLLEKGDLI